MSSQTQNELMDVIGQQIILRHLLEEIKSAKFFTVLADEVTATNTEHLAICAHFVDCRKEIREEFLTFKELKRITGEHIADAILTFLQENGLQVKNIRGQGYWSKQYVFCSSWCSGKNQGSSTSSNIHALQWSCPELGDQPFVCST